VKISKTKAKAKLRGRSLNAPKKKGERKAKTNIPNWTALSNKFFLLLSVAELHVETVGKVIFANPLSFLLSL